MSEVTETGRPRRNTRQSGRLSQLNNGSTPNSAVSTPTSTNPYKKPTYYNSREKSTPPTTPSSTTTPRGRGRGRGRPPGSGSARGGSRGRGYRPECVATRVSDSGGTAARRPSTRGKKKKRGGYSSHADYHYGSDFDSDQAESEPEPQEQSDSESNQSADDTLELEDAVESDSDDSSVASSRLVRLPSPPVPLWLDEEKNSHVEELEIPESSDDLLLPRDLVVKAVSIYEPLRRFHQLVRLTPFRFEDFCAALSEAEQSSLLAEIHIQLLKSILREDEANGTLFGPPDSKDSVQAILFFMDGMTWAESLRAFMESDPAWSDILNVITSVEYPLCGPDVRIKVLGWLVEMFLATNSVREALLAEGNIRHEDHCRHCNRLGELICCETCPAVYHLGCIDPPIKDDEPPDDWRCTICVKNQVLGVSECVSEMEKAGLLIRHDKLGYDRHGRKYWFLARRILVESDDESEVWYYSTMYQVEELLSQLDSELYEAELYDAIDMQKDEIFRQMGITEKVTNSVKGHKKSYIDAENAYLKKVHERRLVVVQSEESQKSKQEEEEQKVKRQEEEEKQKEEEEVRRKDEEEKRKIREERLNRRNKVKLGGFDPDDFDTSPNFDTSYSFDQRDSPKMDDLSNSPPPPSLTKEVDDEEDQNEVKPAEEVTADPDEDAAVKEEILDSDETPATPMEVDTDEKPKEDSGDQKTTQEDTTEAKNGVEAVCSTEHEEKNANTADNPEPKEALPTPAGKLEPTEALPAPAGKLEPKEALPTPAGKLEPKEALPTPAGKLKSKSLMLDMDGEERMTRNKSSGLFKLGQEHAYRSYVNLYSANPLALSRAQHNEERDKKRHMSHKFSLTTASECKWVGGNVYGPRTEVLKVLRQTIVNLEHAVPHALMHVNWTQLKKSWTSSMTLADSAAELSSAMMMLSNCLRSAVYNTIWIEGSGHVKLMRVTSVEREDRKKIEKRDKKDRDEEEDRLRMMPQFVKYSIHPKHQVWKQKGEEYRIHGSRGWLWLATSRPAKPQDCRKMGLLAGPHKHVIQVKSDTGKIKTMLIDPNVFDKLMAKRSATAKKTEVSASSSNGSSDITSDASSPKSVGENCDIKEENIRGSTEGLEMRNESVSEDSREADPQRIQEVVSEKEASASIEVAETENMQLEDSNQIKQPELGEKIEGETTQSSKKVEDQAPKFIVEDESMEINDDLEAEALVKEKVENDVPETTRIESEAPPKDRTKSEDGPSSEKVEDGAEPSLASAAKEDPKPTNILDHHAIETGKGSVEKHEEVKEDSKKVRTELVNVSLGIQSTNRIQYPKIAHRRPKLDNLLSRRLRLQAQEEEMLREKFGEPTLEKLKSVQPDFWKEKAENEFKKLEASFPLAASYALQCYAYECRSEQNESTENRKCRCYSPMCRLKFVIQEAQRRRVEASVLAEKEKFDNMVKEVDSLRNYTKSSSAEKVSLKQSGVGKNLKAPVKYPVSSSFITKVTKKPSIFAIPPHEMRKLARTGGRTCSPTPFSSVVKTGANSWAWPYPCGRPYFKTCWQYRTVHANSLAAVALQLRILYAAIRWDDIVMKPPNFDGKNQITTDTEIVTTEVLQHRYLGRFQERVQYLRRKHLVPLDAPKTVREVTPSRSGLRKRKKVDAPDQTDPLITEEWVDEDHVELWEIKLYHDKQDRKFERKPETPVTGMTSTRIVRRPDKYDPSNIPSSSARISGDVKEVQDTELKMLRAVHQSKRDNHAKANNLQNGKAPMPTASQQLQQQNALASGLRSYPVSGGTGAKKYIISKPGQPGVASAIINTTDSSAPGILNRKIPLARTPGSPATKTTEILAKIYPTQNGQRLVFQTQPHELTATVLAQIQEQLQGLTGLTAGSTISFQIQQPVTAVSTPQRVVSTMTSTSSMLHAGPTRVPSSTPVVQTFRTVEGPTLSSTAAVPTVATVSTSNPVSVTNQVAGTRLAGPITFKKVVRNAAGVEEVIQVVSASGTPQPTTQAIAPATITSAGGFATVQRPNETIARIITGGQTHRIVVQSSTQELTPQVIAQIQNQIQGLPGLPVGTPIPIQIQTTHVPNAAGGARPLLQTQTLIAQKPTGKLQLSVLPPSGSRPSVPGVSASGAVADIKIAASPQAAGLVRAIQPMSSVATPTTTIVHSRPFVSSSSLTPNILKLTQGTTVVTSQQLMKTPDGKLQAVQLVQPTSGISQIVGANSRVVGNTLVTPGVAVATSLPLTSAVSTPSALKVQTLNVSTDALKKVIPGSPVQIRPAPQVPSTLITSIQGNSPAAVGSNATIIKRSNSNIRNTTPIGGPPSVSLSSASVPMKTQEIFAKAVQTTEGLKFVLQTNGHEMPQALLAQIQAQLQVMNVVPGTTVCFHIKTPDTTQAALPTPLSTLRPSLPVSTLPGSPLKIHPATITTTAATVAPPKSHTSTSSPHTQSETKQNVMPISPALTPRLASPIVLKKVVQQQIPEASTAPLSDTVPTTGSDAALKVKSQKPADAVSKMFSEGNTPKIVVQSNNPEISAQLIMQIQNQLQGMQVPLGANIPLEIQSSTGAIINSATISVTGPGAPSPATAVLPGQEPKQVADKPIMGNDSSTKSSEQGKSVADHSASSPAPKVIAGSAIKSATPVKITPSPSKLGQQFLNVSDGRIEATKKIPETASSVVKPSSQSAMSSPLKTTTPPKSPLKSAAALPCKIMQEQVKFTPVKDIAAAPILANEPDVLKDFMPTFNAIDDSMPAADKTNLAQSIVFNDQQFLKALDDKMEVPTPVPVKESPAAFLTHVDAHDMPPIHAVEEVITTVTPPKPSTTPAPRTTSRNRRGRKPSVVSPVIKKIVTPSPKARSKDPSTKVEPLHQQVSALSKQKDLLKKEMLKKRGLLEQQLQEDLQKERAPALIAATSSVGSARGRKSSLTEPSSAAPPSKKQKLYCVCQKPYDDTKFYVGCENCSNWFHGDCVGVTEKMAKKVSEYICDSCQVDDETNKLYCLCRQPYDESQFYICCDKCQDWFHGRCVGVLQAESKQIDEYVCPNCDSRTSLNHANLKTLNFDDYALVTKLLKQLQAHKSAWPFLEPVDPAEARNYYRVIKNPMDLKTIEMKMETKKYSKLRDFIGDVTKIFENCRYYNPPESAFYKAADALETFFAQKITLLRQKLV